MRTIAMTICVAWAIALAGCAPAGPDSDDGRLRVFAAVPPLADIVRRVGGPEVAVETLVSPGQSPHAYEPTPQQMAGLARARVFFAIGLPFEDRLLEKALDLNPDLKVVDCRGGLVLRWMEGDADEADHADDHSHAAGEPDPHVWLSPANAARIAATVARTLQSLDPARGQQIQSNLASLQAVLAQTDERLRQALAPLKGREVFVYHPAFGYFLDAYGLRQRPVETGGKEPGPKALANLIEQARAAGVRVVFVQPQFSARSAAAVADAIGGAVVPLDALPDDLVGNFDRMAEALKAGLAPAPATPRAGSPDPARTARAGQARRLTVAAPEAAP
jgi:zinc transport system substrate-binding protein